jgi:hypothetical protein
MVFSRDYDYDGRDNGRNKESKIDLDVGEENKPLIPRSFFELAGGFSAAYAACWIFSSDTWACQSCSQFTYNVTTDRYPRKIDTQQAQPEDQ